MDYSSAFAISGSGMSVEKMRLDVTALNLANVHSTRARDGSGYEPLQVISAARQAQLFQAAFSNASHAGLPPAPRCSKCVPPGCRRGWCMNRTIRMPTSAASSPTPASIRSHEMVTLISALRAYEANVVALNAAKTMALKALELGGNS